MLEIQWGPAFATCCNFEKIYMIETQSLCYLGAVDILVGLQDRQGLRLSILGNIRRRCLPMIHILGSRGTRPERSRIYIAGLVSQIFQGFGGDLSLYHVSIFCQLVDMTRGAIADSKVTSSASKDPSASYHEKLMWFFLGVTLPCPEQ